MYCRELTVLLQLTCATFNGGTHWTTTSRGLLLDAIQRLSENKKAVPTDAESILVRLANSRH